MVNYQILTFVGYPKQFDRCARVGIRNVALSGRNYIAKNIVFIIGAPVSNTATHIKQRIYGDQELDFGVNNDRIDNQQYRQNRHICSITVNQVNAWKTTEKGSTKPEMIMACEREGCSVLTLLQRETFWLKQQ